jgi:prepilin-type processing-associated H-X9-DG protein
LNDLLTAVTFSCNVNPAGQMAGVAPDNSAIVNPCRKILGTYPGGSFLSPNTEQRRKVVEDEVLKQGYNTNYAASWFLVRGAPLLDGTGNVLAPAGCTASLKERSSTTGPLREMDCDRIGARTTTIPLLGCAAESGTFLSQSLGKTTSGTPLAISFTAGPVLKTTMAMPSVSSGSSWTVWNKQVLQDYRAFAPLHARTCNVLFVDGGVRSLVDTNRDGYLNNGFPASPTAGFQDNIVEVGVDQIRSQWNVTSR